MRLKTLRLFGFKSFADKAEFDFPDGVTAIVGPNGCGKSNVVDAVKWVLGEQRPTALRGKDMSDVIFGGTEKRKPLGMAEVTLVFDNTDGALDVDFSEVEVTRRLYRDGSSEYRLNRRKCRLRDLRELLMDTGSGPGALTFMEQGRIDQILRESVADRRAVFEEAAGISKYKARRKECLRRLERVEADLLRVSDVVEEKQRLVRSLKVQAGRAERYQALVDELRAKRLQLAVHRYGLLFEQRRAAADRVSEFAEQEEAARMALQAALAAAQEAEGELDSARQVAARMEREIATLEGRSENAREKSVFAARLAAELDGKIRWYTDEIEGATERLEELTSVRQDLAGRAERAERQKSVQLDAVREVETRLNQARTTHRARRADVERLDRERLAAVSRQGSLGNRRSRLLAATESADARERRIEARLVEVGEEESELAERVRVAEAERETADRASERARSEHARAESDVAEADASTAELRERVNALEVDVGSARSRVDVLRSLTERMEGVGEGARKLLASLAEHPIAGVHGLLVDLLDVAPDRAGQLETALGDLASAIVVDDRPSLEQIAARVEAERLGRCAVLVLGHGTRRRESPTGLLAELGCEPRIAGRLSELLGEVRAVAGLADALDERGADASSGIVWVGADGSRTTSSGAVEIGGAGGGAGLLQRRAELAELEERLARDAERLSAAREALTTARVELQEARRTLTARRTELRTAEAELQRVTSQRDRIAGTGQAHERERERLAREMEQVETERARCSGELETVDADLAELAGRQLEIERARSDAEAVEERCRTDVERLESERSDARVELASVSERAASVAARLRGAEREARELEQDAAEARTELDAARERRADAVARGQAAKEELARTDERREQCLREVIELRHAVSQAQSALEERRKLAKELDAQAASVSRELQRFRLRENEARTRLEGLVERIAEELDVDLAEAWSSAAATGDDEPVSEESVSDEPEAEIEEEPFDAEEVEALVGELKAKIGRMGAVNLEALSQLQTAEAEARYLEQQHGDLTRSRESLMQAVKRIDEESRELFQTTFETVRTHFRDLYRRLFGGGRADVFLEDGVDILEAGVQIVARPPGKEQRAISLLSGGERTMTAVALMFAIYMAKPSPFCLLDEVDAALDESNVDRFVAVLREFAVDSQFIVVTHNKRTMTAAGTIFGVSMPERGVSRRIAVRLEDVGPDGQLREAG